MSVPYQPQNLAAQTSDGSILLTWSPSLSATSYQVQRSLDGLTFTNLATAAVSLDPQYLDQLPGTGIMYWYQVAGLNSDGTSVYSSIVQMVAAPPAEMSLFELRLRSQQRADRVRSQFVVTSEWNFFIGLAMYELYDLLMTSYEDLFASEYVFINTSGTLERYPLPDGTNYLGGVYPSATGAPAKSFYKLAGVDLGINTSNNAWVTLPRFDFIERNAYVYPNSTSTIYGVYNMRYRLMGNFLNVIPTPAGNQQVRLWYSPRLAGLLRDTDLTTIGYSGWLQYAIVRAAKYALDKEESDTSKLDAEIAFLKMRIEQTSQNRDAGIADTISETRQDPVFGGTGWGGGGQGGWAFVPLGLLPGLAKNDVGYGALIDAVHVGQLLLTILAGFVCLAYFLYRRSVDFRGRIALAAVGRLGSGCPSSLPLHVRRVVGGRPEKQMVRSNAAGIVTVMAHEKTGRNCSKVDLPGSSVRGNVSPRAVRFEGGNSAITAVHTSRVFPTRGGLDDVGPKSIDAKFHGTDVAEPAGESSGGW